MSDEKIKRNVSKISTEYCKFLVYECRKNLQVSPDDHPLGCWIPNKVPRDDGYVRINIKDTCYEQAGISNVTSKSLDVYLHLVAYKAKYGTVPDGVQSHCSHKCGIGACFFVNHMVVEDPKLNNARKNCTVCVETLMHDGNGKQIVFDVCPHNPPCIRATKYSKKKKFVIYKGKSQSIVMGDKLIRGGIGGSKMSKRHSAFTEWQKEQSKEKTESKSKSKSKSKSTSNIKVDSSSNKRKISDVGGSDGDSVINKKRKKNEE